MKPLILNNNKKMVNILLSTYNSSDYLCEQLDSIISQTYTDWCVFIRDDGSTNDTLQIINKYVDEYSGKIILIQAGRENLGPCQSYSRLLEFSTADYIMFADQDDIWIPEKLEICMLKMQKMEKQYGTSFPLLVHTDLKVVNKNLKVLQDSFMSYQNISGFRDQTSQLLLQNSITGCTVLMNKALKDISIPIPNRACMHDWWLALVASLFGKIGFVDMATVYYRQHDENCLGAQKSDAAYLISKLKNFRASKLVLHKAIFQSISLNEKYGAILKSDQKKMMDSFSNILNKGMIKKRLILLKYGIGKFGILRNLGLFLLI